MFLSGIEVSLALSKVSDLALIGWHYFFEKFLGKNKNAFQEVVTKVEIIQGYSYRAIHNNAKRVLHREIRPKVPQKL